MSTYTTQILKRLFCRLFFPGIMILVMLGNVSVVSAQDTQFRELQDRYLRLVTTMLRNQRRQPQVLPRFVPGVKRNIEIKPELFVGMNSKVLSAENVTITDSGFTQQELNSQDYVPFKIDQGRVIVSRKIFDAPESQFFFYMTFMKIYTALHPSLLENPNVVCIGICALIAQEFTYGSTLAVLPRFFDETALANLLYCYDPTLIQLPFDKENFNLQTFKNKVITVLQEFCNIRGSDVEYMFNIKEDFEIHRVLCNLKPGLLESFCNKIDTEIHHLTVRSMIYNALYQCFEETISQMPLAQRLMSAFREELRIRYGEIPLRLDDLRFEKNTFGSLYQFIYNGSSVIPKELKAAGLATLRLDKPEVVEQRKEEIVKIVTREKNLKPLLELLALSTIELREKTDESEKSDKSNKSNVLGFQWWIGRKTMTPRRDFEFIHTEFVSRPITPPDGQGETGGGKSKNSNSSSTSSKNIINSKSINSIKSITRSESNTSSRLRGKGEIGPDTGGEGPHRFVGILKEKPIPEPGKDVIFVADLTQIKPPFNWERRKIHLGEDDLNALKTLYGANRIEFNLTHSLFSRLDRNERKELRRFISHFADLRDVREIQGDFLQRLTRLYLEHYAKQKETFLKNPDIRLLRYMIQKYLFLSYISNIFGLTSNERVLDQEILEIVLRTIFSRKSGEYEGYEYFADLKNSLVYLLKYIQDKKYFFDNSGNQCYAYITVDISQRLNQFVSERLSAINRGIDDGAVEIAIHEVVGGNKINLRNLFSQLDRLKDRFNRDSRSSRAQLLFQRICDCSSYASQLHDCLLLADDHAITETDDINDAFEECFGRYFSLQDTRLSSDKVKRLLNEK